MRTYVQWKDWDKFEKETGFKSAPRAKVNKEKQRSLRKKFATCPKCGGQMEYCPGTNILVCENVVNKKEKVEVPAENGAAARLVEKDTKSRCGFIKMVDSQYEGYLNYLYRED